MRGSAHKVGNGKVNWQPLSQGRGNSSQGSNFLL